MTSNDSTNKRQASDHQARPSKRRSRHRKQYRAEPETGDPAPPTRAAPPEQTNEPRPRAQLKHFQASHFCSYSSSTRTWTQDAYSDTSPMKTSLKLLTYNIWSSSPEHTQSQTAAILDVLSRSSADVIALQEVSKPFEAILRKEGWVQAEWALTSLDEYWKVAGKDGQGKGKKEGKREGILLMVRKALSLSSEECEIGFVKLKRANNEQAKALIMLRFFRNGVETLRLSTSHFSSLPQNARLRKSQYSIALSLLNTFPRATHSILLGDFNASSSTELDLFAASLVDVGPTPSKAQLSKLASREEKRDLEFRHRPTFGALYPLVSLASPKPRKPRRIDRIYLSKGTKQEKYKELGGEALVGEKDALGAGGKRYPSDHLAIGITIEIG